MLGSAPKAYRFRESAFDPGRLYTPPMRPRRHARSTFLGKAFEHAGVWVPILVIGMLLLALVLGGPSPRY